MHVRPRVVLASGSSARRQMLAAAGVEFAVDPAQIDEAAYTAGFERAVGGGACPEEVALGLAWEKAKQVGLRHPGALVIGSDQVLACGADLFSKVADRDGARETLKALRGKVHHLHSAVVLMKDGRGLWSKVRSAELGMREFSDAFLEAYLDQAGDGLFSSVGCYQLEGRGVHLFERIEGDYFTILGMPLLPLLAELRAEGALVE